MAKTIKRMLILITLLYLGILLGMAVFQRHLQYFPTTDPASNLAEQTVTFDHQGESLKGWILNPGKPQAVIYFGGNAEQISQNGPLFNETLANYTVYLINYRSYGDSTGQATETNLFDDALYIYDQIHRQYDNIAAIGRSLGTGIAVHLAANRAIDKLILITPYDSITRVAQRRYWFLPISLLLKDKYQSWKKADKISAKTMIFIAQLDRIVPPNHAKNLIKYFNRDVITQMTITSAHHNDISYYPQFKTALAKFVN